MAPTAPAEFGSASSRELLNSIRAAPDGTPYSLLQLRGWDVPQDLELFFCRRTYTTIQIRVKVRGPAGVEYEYSTCPKDTQKGVFSLQCQRSAHHLQVKVQPTLGLGKLLPSLVDGATVAEQDLHSKKLVALVGLYHLLAAFHRDPTLDSVPLASTQRGATKHVHLLVEEGSMLQACLAACDGILAPSAAQRPDALRLMYPERPRTRGILLKALLELKMLIIDRAFHERKALDSLSGSHAAPFRAVMAELEKDCLPGGVQAQYLDAEASAATLQRLVLGSTSAPPAGEASAANGHPQPGAPTSSNGKTSSGPSASAAPSTGERHTNGSASNKSAPPRDLASVVDECVSDCKTAVSRLQEFGIFDFKPPLAAVGHPGQALTFKMQYNRIVREAVKGFLFEECAQQHTLERAQELLREQWTKPDALLVAKFPNSQSLRTAVQEWANAFEDTFTQLTEESERVGKSWSSNSSGFVGLQNCGDNLCASNSLLQLLFSVRPLREAVCELPDAAASPPVEPVHGHVEAEAVPSRLDEATQLMKGLRRLFLEMSEASGRTSASSRDVAVVLQGGEIGEQQDCDEILHRLSALVQDGLSHEQGAPFGRLQQVFRRAFLGATRELRAKRGAGGAAEEEQPFFEPVTQVTDYDNQDPSCKEFLSIPVQQDNRTLAQALDDFTGWAATGGQDVAFTQDVFRTLPPFLCFASRQVSAFDWEETLNLTRFVAPQSIGMQRNHYETSQARQQVNSLREALHHITAAANSLDGAASLSGARFTPVLQDEASQIHAGKARIQSALSQVEERIQQLEEARGDGFEDPPLLQFLSGAVGETTVNQVVTGLLGVDTVKKLSDLALETGGKESDTLSQLVQGEALKPDEAEAILSRLMKRWNDQHAELYEVHAVVCYQGAGLVGHYICFIRQADGGYVCFDDERVTLHGSTALVKEEIAQRGSDAFPASVRMLVYRRIGPHAEEPIQIAAESNAGSSASSAGDAAVAVAAGATAGVKRPFNPYAAAAGGEAASKKSPAPSSGKGKGRKAAGGDAKRQRGE